ncbi:MAG: hypothetical protein WCV90_07135 [Candidatus Woesearchaeota archaeon]
MNQPFNFSSVFANLPEELRFNLEERYGEIIRNFRENRFEPSELNGAKFAEAVFRTLEWYTSSTKVYTPFGTSIRDFEQASRKFESMSSFPDSMRFHIPKLLASIYSLRNKRGVGHIGGDINPNHMDASLVVSISKWILAELVRIFYAVNLQEANTIVEHLVAKEFPIVWDVLNRKRILDTSLDFNKKVLVLLHSCYPNPVNEKNLLYWVEYSNPSFFRTKILIPLHEEKMIEYDNNSKYILISPKGIKFVEEKVPLKF